MDRLEIKGDLTEFIRIELYPNRKFNYHISHLREILFHSLHHHPVDHLLYSDPVGSSQFHDGPDGVWRHYYAVGKSKLEEFTKQIVLPILENQDESFSNLISGEFFIEVVYVDGQKQPICWNSIDVETVSFSMGLKSLKHELENRGIVSCLLETKLVIGNLETYNEVYKYRNMQ